MSENEYVATAAAQKRLREVLTGYLGHIDSRIVETFSDALLAVAQVEYKPRAKAVLITLPLPDKAALSQMGTAADLDQAVTETEGAGNELGAIPGEKCWCGGAVGRREPGDENGLGCLADISHNWQAASAESQAIIEAETVQAPPQPHITPYQPKQFAEPDYEDVHYD